MKKINIAGCGGAAKGLSLFGVLKELCEKEVKIKKAFLTSVSTIMLGGYAVGLSAKEIRDKMISIRFDTIMEWQEDIEEKRGSVISRITKIPIVFLFGKVFWFKDVQRIFIETYSWEKVKLVGRVDKLFIGFTTRREVANYDGRGTKMRFFRDAISAMSKGGRIWKRSRKDPEKVKARFERAYHNIGMFWGSDDGIYKFNVKKNKLEKYSDDIIPLWALLLGAFNNPFLRKVKLSIKGKEQIAFDLGIINNHSNIPYMGSKDFHQLIPDPESYPDKDFSTDFTLADYVFNKNRPSPSKTHIFDCVRDKAFMSFTDEQIRLEFKYQKKTNIFS